MEKQLRQVCSELGRNLRSNQACSSEEILASHPELASNSSAALEVIYTEFVVREELGQKPSPREWYARFPQWRTDLEELFQVHEFVVDEESRISQVGGSTMRRAQARTVADGSAVQTRSEHGISGYQIEEELGRGGMGVVYRARQKSLNRVVALKMILAGEYASPEELARFRSEAEANAALQHPNIVQIFEIGEEHGHAFLAQEYVAGGSLQRKLAEWQSDGTVGMAPESAAGLLLVLSRAVQFAHQRGIVHRDLKPANILLSTDGFDSEQSNRFSPEQPAFVPKIADFGLAKMCHRDDSQVTHSGAILGTPSYMAPEQAAGEGRSIGIPTDIYALGAILYELLTGRPPFRGTSIMETLEQVRQQEPVRPSRLQPSTPRDLETICLKCLQKEPQRRYASASDLAEDLDRYLHNKPIVARPSSFGERAVKWSKRQPLIASLLAVTLTVLLILVAGALFSNAALRAANDRERERTRQAEHQQKVAEAHRAESERQYRTARDLVDRFTQIGVRLTDQPRVEKVRRELLQQALAFYQQTLTEKSSDPEIQFEAALASSRVGAIQHELGQLNESLASYQQSVKLLRQLVEDFPANVNYRWELAASLRGCGLAEARLQRHVEAEAMWKEAIDRYEELVQQSPTNNQYVVMLANTIANQCVSLIALRRFDEAEGLYERAISLHKKLLDKSPNDFRSKQDLALCYDDLGDFYWTRRRPEDAEKMCSLSYEMRTQLLRTAQNDLTTQTLLARSCRNLGKIYSETGRMEQAAKSYGQAIQLLERLRDEHLDVPAYSIELAHCYRRRGIVLHNDADMAKATKEYRRFLQINPAYPPTNNSLAWHLAATKKTSPAEAREAVTLSKKAVGLMPNAATYWNTLGAAHYRAGEFKEAVAALDKSIELGKERDLSNWFLLALAYHRLNDSENAQLWLKEGLQLLTHAGPPNLETNQFRDEALAILSADSRISLPPEAKTP